LPPDDDVRRQINKFLAGQVSREIFTGSLPTAYCRVIVQRHANALIFSSFVHQLAGDAFKMQAGGFFGCPSGARGAEQLENAAAQLIEFATKPTTRQALSLPMEALTRGSALEGDPEIFDRAADLMKNVREDFAREWRALQDLQGQRTDDVKAASRGLEIQIRRLCEDYLLSVLSARGFLPGHGFPSGVVSLPLPDRPAET
jgi:hypothetical protein